MGALFTVFAKEFLDNLRDRRTLVSALLFGPLMFGLMVSRMLEQSVTLADEPLQLTISGSEQAPGLTRYLETRGVRLTRMTLAENEARAAIRRGSAPVVLIIPAEYATRFTA